MSVAIAVTGATGRMGQAVLAAASEREDVTVALAVNRDPDPSGAESADGDADRSASVAGVPVEPACEFDRLLAERDPDAVVDFTGPASSQNYVAVAAEAGVASVVGTTGFDDEGEQALRELAEYAPVLKASNFGRGVHALLSAVESAVADLPGYDVEITETHHNRKRDAPSGTAKTILETVEDARADSGARVHGREGEAPAKREKSASTPAVRGPSPANTKSCWLATTRRSDSPTAPRTAASSPREQWTRRFGSQAGTPAGTTSRT